MAGPIKDDFHSESGCPHTCWLQSMRHTQHPELSQSHLLGHPLCVDAQGTALLSFSTSASYQEALISLFLFAKKDLETALQGAAQSFRAHARAVGIFLR